MAENRKIAISQRKKIIRLWWNWVHDCTFGTRWQPDDQIWKCSKFKMANAAISKVTFWP